ncbi:hypothetical protein [Geodermatophilus sabuli]|uniref:Uncharacterized protein n=1 Tax=Geodermatophilus sabuli TaxID=1564158 RepID=A0A285EK05_9ACTN|nr:hypothetical protein [Geodermatophilus sabuli]MBB3086046.1 hypothetical protein [Geodermatophilus sabuli]SNX98386.1 hypothetical protein SAMN06893097_110170 [Geodermatophilus sabuli]
MISTMWFSAPAGVSGSGGLVARPATWVCLPAASRLRALPLSAAVRIAAPGAPFQGTAVPGASQVDLVPTGRGGDAARGADDFPAPTGVYLQDERTDDDTTLGIHSPGRPLS